MTARTKRAIAVAGAALTLCTSAPASWFSSESASEPLYRAHESFLRRDLRRMTSDLKEVFLDTRTDEAAKKNAMALLEKAYQLRRGATVPVDWTLPPEIPKMKITLMRAQRPTEENYGLKVSGNAQAVGTIRQIKVTRFPNEVVLDKLAKIGEWTDIIEPGEGPYFELDGPRTARPAEDGLYLLHIEQANGRVTEGWFILSNLVASETPVVHTPSVGETFATPNPTFKWNHFVSPEYQSFERRSIWSAVVKSEPPLYAWNEVWTLFEEAPTRTQVTIGVDPSGVGVKQLTNGRYLFYVAYKETRRFGDLRLGRQSLTMTPFHVRSR